MSPAAKGLVLVRGAGDLATGVLTRLHAAGYAVGALECERPTAIRRGVALSEAVYEGRTVVEGIEARLLRDLADFRAAAESRLFIPLLVDEGGRSIPELRPLALVDAILAKRNLGTRAGMASLVIALGPGFRAGAGDPSSVDAVIETNRGHDLGRVIWQGRAQEDSGVPGELGGASLDRVCRAPASGTFIPHEEIGNLVGSGSLIAYIEKNNERISMYSKIDGVLRGMLRAGLQVPEGMKVADVDPRGSRESCFTVSDKARAIAGGVLEALLARGVLP